MYPARHSHVCRDMGRTDGRTEGCLEDIMLFELHAHRKGPGEGASDGLPPSPLSAQLISSSIFIKK